MRERERIQLFAVWVIYSGLIKSPSWEDNSGNNKMPILLIQLLIISSWFNDTGFVSEYSEC
jgi:hypothetical protein